jgi:hypothetical protein
MPQQPAVTLTDEERTTLEAFVHRGRANARTLTRARILLKSADGWSTATIAEALDVCQAEGNSRIGGRRASSRWARLRWASETLDRGTYRSVGFRGTAVAVKDYERKV